ncbi:MAG TPA: RHS repeat-associated core domain-containing protein [Polyangiaceae bacterium]|nr:RHS repeat-associated core domain-containing protein [Polyangiaceae bacterium]
MNSTDRAPGWLSAGSALGTGGTKSGNLYVALVAPSDKDIIALKIGYDIEKYSNGTNPTGFRVQLYSSLDGVNWTNAGSDFLNSLPVNANNLGFDPVPGQTINVLPKTLTVAIPHSTRFFLAWNYTVDSATSTDGSNAQAIAIDNVSIVGDFTCAPNCAGKVCGGDLSDGCGNTCPGVCDVGEEGCTGASAAACKPGLICGGHVTGSTSPTVCTDPICVSNPRTGGCGYPGAPCGSSCTPSPICTISADCPSGYVCGKGNGWRYGVPGQNVCESTGCPALGCGSSQSPCGLCTCTAHCENKRCGDADLSDGCGGICPSLCTDGDPGGCGSDVDCQPGSYCAFGQGERLGLPAGSNACMLEICSHPDISRLNCGTVFSMCGACPSPLGECAGRECGPDPVTGASCGVPCADGKFCSGSGTCIVPEATPPITVKNGTEPVVPPTSPPAPGFGATPGTFSVTALGSALYNIPIAVPPGRHGIEPNLAVRYTSSTSNGTLGVGWSLDGLSTISLCPRTYAQDGQAKPVSLIYGEALCLDGQRLVAAEDGYHTANDTFTKIVGDDSGGPQGHPYGFRAFMKDGRILRYDLLANWKNNGESYRFRTWALSRIEDRNGNFMRIVYRQTTSTDSQDSEWRYSSTELVPDSIVYTGSGSTDGDREIKFQYSDSRPDKLFGFQVGGGVLARTLRLEHIEVRASHALVRRYDLGYETASNNASRLKTLQECAGPTSICKGATTFKYKTEQGFGAGVSFTPPYVNPNLNSGAPDFLAPYGTALGTASGYDILSTESDNATTIPTQPIPGGADMAVQVIPVAGQIAGAIIGLINLFGASSYQQHWFVRVFYDFQKKTFDFGGRCNQRERATEHVIRNGYGDGDHIYDTCPGEPLTWFIDVDGDGVQDRLQCSGAQELAYYLARNHNHRVPTDISNLPTPDGKHSAPGNLCANPGTWAQWSVTPAAFRGDEPPKPPFIGAFDVDGDGTSNLFYKDKLGVVALFFDSGEPIWRRLSTDAMPLVLDNRYVAFLDANGDGLRDILALPSNKTPEFQTAVLWVNTGTGFRQTLLCADSVADAMSPPYVAYVVDYDHDGIDDLIESQVANGSVAQPWFIRRFDNGKVSKQILPDPGPGYPGALGDWNGDGNLDLLTRKPNTFEYFMHYGTGRLQNALEAVIDGFDRRVDIQYDIMNPEGDHTYTASGVHYESDTNAFNGNGTDCWWPNKCAGKLDHILVSSYRESHRETAGAFLLDKDTRLSYHAEIDDVAGFGPLGFEAQRTTVRDAAGSLLKQTSLTNVVIPSSIANPTMEAPYQRTLAGLPSTVHETTPPAQSALTPELPGNYQFRDTAYSWVEQTSASGRPFAVLQTKKSTTSFFSPGSWYSVALFEKNEQFTVDGFGNTTDHVVAANDFDLTNTLSPVPVPGSTSTFHEHRTFNPTEEEIYDWQISLLKAEEVTDHPRCYGSTTTCNSEARTRHTDFTYYPTGELHTTTRAAGDVTSQVETTLGRDAFGNVYQVDKLDAAGDLRTTITGYDDRGMFPISITNRLGQTTQVRFDDRFGKLAVRVDPNEIAQTWTYDDFGVLRVYRGPGGQESTDYEPDGTTSTYGFAVMGKYRIIKHQAGGGTLTQRFNSLGQLVARETSGLTGSTVVEEFGYDARDRLSVSSRPHLPQDYTQGLVRYGYDGLDRLTTVTLPNGSVSHKDYALISTATDEARAFLTDLGVGVVSVARMTDAKAHVSYQFLDRDGRPLAAVDANARTTAYRYGAFNTLGQIIAPNGTLSYVYDNFGRVLSATDAAVGGDRKLTYNGLDEVVSGLDPAGRQSSVFYDELGRRKTLNNADGTTTWTYDEGPNAIGRLSGTLSPSGQQTAYGFEAPSSGSNRGLLETVTRSLVSPNASTSLPPTVLTTTYHYDQFSRLEQIDYPGDSNTALSIKYGFDAAGHVTSVSDAADASNVYWQLTGAKQGYLPSLETFGNGVTTERQYEDLTGYLSSITTKHGASLIQQLSYGGYDANGNLGHRTDALTGVTESFGYDALDRVTSTSYGNAYSPEPFAYDPISNALSHRGRVGDYTYFATGRDWIERAGANEYTHDSFGNIQTRSGPDVPGTTQEFTNTTFDLPSHVSLQTDPGGGIDFAYDSSGSRVLKQSSSQTTFYSNDLYQRTVPSGTTGATSHRFMIYAGGRAIAAVFQPQASGPAAIAYLHDDSLGSIQAATASDASVVENRHFDTFGAPWGSAVSWAQVPFGYTGQEQDSELGLVNMGGRLYDPSIGQFLSADPLIQEPSGQGLNRFAYVFNSPLNYTDPSGFSAEDVSEGAAIGVGTGFFTGLVVHLLTSGGAAGTVAASAAATTTAAVPAVADTALAGAGVATAAPGLAAAGVGAGMASSIAFNIIMSARQPTSTIVTAQPGTRSATAAGTGQTPIGRSGFATSPTSATVEPGTVSAQRAKSVLGFDPKNPNFTFGMDMGPDFVPTGSPRITLDGIPGDNIPPHSVESPQGGESDSDKIKAGLEKALEAASKYSPHHEPTGKPLGETYFSKGTKAVSVNVFKTAKPSVPIWPFVAVGVVAVGAAVYYCHENPDKCD